MRESWIRFAVRPSVAALREVVSTALFAADAGGVLEDGDWLVTYFPADADLQGIEARVRACDSRAAIETRGEAPADWSVGWRHGVTAHTLGRLTVAPPWLASAYDPATTIIVEPGMAFGTGEHPTTRGVIRLMQLELRPGDTVADLGAGSAVLSIAAAKLGAGRVAAIELDHDAIGNAEENVGLSNVAHAVTVIEGDAALLLPLVAPVRVVLANIVSSVLLDLLPVIANSLADDGIAILSGILIEESERMTWMLGLKGWRILHEDREDAWWSACIGR